VHSVGQSLAEAAVDAEAEGGVGARPGAVDDELVGARDGALVSVPRDVPQGDLLAFLILLPPTFSGTALSSRAGLARSRAYSPGCWSRASRPPVIEWRVVSEPATIKRLRLHAE
jgi:hypothetical protein